jgi:hypothetical protein
MKVNSISGMLCGEDLERTAEFYEALGCGKREPSRLTR